MSEETIKEQIVNIVSANDRGTKAASKSEAAGATRRSVADHGARLSVGSIATDSILLVFPMKAGGLFHGVKMRELGVRPSDELVQLMAYAVRRRRRGTAPMLVGHRA